MFPKPKRYRNKQNVAWVTSLPCVACKGISCAHHIKSKGSGGGDHLENLMPVCIEHHTEVHKIGLRGFAEKYWGVKRYLVNLGWHFDDISNKWEQPESLNALNIGDSETE